MCYHTNTPKKENLSKILKPSVEILPYPELEFANGFEQPEVPVMKNDNSNVVVPWPWSGFIIPGQKFGYTTLNAKSETIFESKLYGSSIRERRCLMFVQGFYEWSEVGVDKRGKKKPYYITRKDGMPFAMAGIWKDWGMVGGQPHRSMSIITTDADELMSSLRPETPRATLVLDANCWDQWLDPHATENQIKELFRVYPDHVFQTIELEHSPLIKKKDQVLKNDQQGSLF